MLNIKTLIAATLLSCVAVGSFAQAPVTTAKSAPVTPIALTAVATPATATPEAKPVAKKVKHSHAKKAATKPAA
jgi:hypothetical protein